MDFIGQLTAQERVFDVRPQRGRKAEHRVDAGPGAPAAPSVLLLSRSCDAELDCVQMLLRRAGVPAERINADELAHVDLLIDAANGTARLDSRWLAPTVTWIRHFSGDSIDAGPAGQAASLFHRASWQAAAEQLAAISGKSILAQRPPLLSQLALARRNQVAVPRTIVTTDLTTARQAFSCPRVVVKSAGRHFVEAQPGRLTGIFATIVQRDQLRGSAGTSVTSATLPHGSPLVVQEYIEHEAELRVYYVAGQVYAYQVTKSSPAELWSDPERVKVRPVDASAATIAATRMLAASMSLHFGAFDFLVRGGAPVFLEVNPDGDWRWAEGKSPAMPVTQAAARMLAGHHHELRRAMPQSLNRGAGALDLLGFLSGKRQPGPTSPLPSPTSHQRSDAWSGSSS